MYRLFWVTLVPLLITTCSSPGDTGPSPRGLLFLGRDTLWTIDVNGGTPRPIPAVGASDPRYSPDGKWIGYVARASGNGQELWLWSPAEGYAVQLTDLGARTLTWSWSPDGTRITFANSLRGNPDIYTVSVPGGQVQRLTTDTRYDVQPTWTPEGSSIVFVRMDQWWVDHDVIVIDAADGSGERVIVTDRDWMDYRMGQEFGPGQVSPRGDLVLFRSYRNGWINWWVVPLENGEPRPVAPEEADQNSQKPFRGYARWSPDGGSIAYTSNLRGTQILKVASVDDGTVRALFAPEMGLAANPVWSPDGSRIAFTLDSPRDVPDLFVVDVATGDVARLTHSVPDASMSEALFVPEKVSYLNDGFEIHSYLFRPSGPPPPNGYPAIVWVHGGPSSQFEDGWRRLWQAHYFVKHGYVVLAPNIRGSSGFGLAHEHANNGCWARCDLDDVVAGAEFLGSLPDVNGDRVAVTGTSYGGYLSFAAGTFAPDVFRAAVPTVSGYADRIQLVESQSALANINMYQYELGLLSENRETFRLASPTLFAQDVGIPMLIIAGEGDRQMRGFATEAARYYKPVEYVLYEEVAGREARLEWMPRMLAFLDRHLKGDVDLWP